ncbi:MAG: ACT domain-containing protein [Clostridiales bacterium]|jgi:chorismate mutase|nr:ACT domain-containing protein [Clostridiales bacterium]
MPENKMIIIQSKVLPDVFEKVIHVKRLLKKGEATTIQQACEMASLSRSTFYKYKDSVFDYSTQERGKIVNLFMLLKHEPGVLSDIINVVASLKGNILTINQNIPVMDVASLTMTIDTKYMDATPAQLVKLLSEKKGCKKVEIIAME